MLNSMYRLLSTASDRLAVLAGWMIIVFAVVLSAETVLRKVAGISIQGLDEYGGYVFAIAAAVGFSYALIQRAHIRVDILLRFVARPRRAVLHVLSILSLTFFALMILYSGIGLWMSSWSLSARAVSPLQTPLVVPQGIWLAGLGMFALSCIVIAAISLLAALKGDWERVETIAGVPSVEEEAQEEIKSARDRGVSTSLDIQ